MQKSGCVIQGSSDDGNLIVVCVALTWCTYCTAENETMPLEHAKKAVMINIYCAFGVHGSV